MNFSFSQLFSEFNTVDSYTIMAMLLIAFLFGFFVDRILMGMQSRKLADNNDKLKRQLAAIEKEKEVWRQQVDTLKEKTENADSQLPVLQVEIDRLRNELAQAKNRAQQADQEKSNLFSEIEGINQELEQFHSAKASYLATIEDLKVQIAGLESDKKELSEKLKETAVAITSSSLFDADSSDDQLRALEQRVNFLETENISLKEELESFQEPRSEGEPAPGAEHSDSEASTDLPVADEEKEAEEEEDDLTLIKGIGPYIAKKLNSLGVSNFEQISQWDERHVQAVTEQLDYFEGRIKKDDWVGQAQKLYRMKTDDPEAFAGLFHKPQNPEDLKIIEGVGPKIERILKEAGINTWDNLADASEEHLKAILGAAGDHFRIHDPKTWPIQARLAVNGHWDLLGEYQEQLKGGREIPPES